MYNLCEVFYAILISIGTLVVESVIFGAVLQGAKNVIGEVFSEERYVLDHYTLCHLLHTFVTFWLVCVCACVCVCVCVCVCCVCCVCVCVVCVCVLCVYVCVCVYACLHVCCVCVHAYVCVVYGLNPGGPLLQK